MEISKMSYTNREKLNTVIAVWTLMDNYNYDERENVISATTLLKPVRQICLGMKFKDNLKVIDASDLINSSMGTALHDSVEKAWKNEEKTKSILRELGYSDALYDEVVLERRSEKEINGYIISGQFDIAFRGTVCDIKSTSVWSYIFGSKDEDYKLQMSIYKWLNQDIITDDKGYIEFIFTDWSAVKAMQDKQYPQSRIMTKEIRLLSIEETEKFIVDKLAEVDRNKILDEKKIVKCTDEDLWLEPTVWKHYKTGDTTKRATKVYDSYEESTKAVGGKVVEFKGSAKRCNYCNYINICSQYIELKVNGQIK